MKYPFRTLPPKLPNWGAVGDFAFRRSFYYHPGIDLYCADLQPVQAMEAGTVVHIEQFTGANADPPSPWWMDTQAVLIEGASGVIGYCEIALHNHLKVGTEVSEGESIAVVIPVLKKDKGNGTTMLHLEHYRPGTRNHVTWVLDTDKPQELLNPRDLLQPLIT